MARSKVISYTLHDKNAENVESGFIGIVEFKYGEACTCTVKLFEVGTFKAMATGHGYDKTTTSFIDAVSKFSECDLIKRINGQLDAGHGWDSCLYKAGIFAAHTDLT